MEILEPDREPQRLSDEWLKTQLGRRERATREISTGKD